MMNHLYNNNVFNPVLIEAGVKFIKIVKYDGTKRKLIGYFDKFNAYKNATLQPITIGGFTLKWSKHNPMTTNSHSLKNKINPSRNVPPLLKTPRGPDGRSKPKSKPTLPPKKPQFDVSRMGKKKIKNLLTEILKVL